MAKDRDRGGAVGSADAAPRRRFVNYPRSHVKSFRRWLPSWRVLVGTMLAGMALVAGVVIAAYNTITVPLASDLTKFEASTVYFDDGETEMGKLFASDGNREIVEYDSLPDYVGNAVVASEDRTFWTNSGIDLRGIARAAVNNLTGGERQGASTLTQQYAERYYMGTTTDYVGKFREAILALKITNTQEKDDILGNYLNTIYFGRDAYGIESAAQTYFHKSATELTISESAMIAGLIPSPRNWDPESNLEMSQARWQRTLDNMLEDGYITQQEYDEAEFPEYYDWERENRYGGTDGYLLKMVEEELIASERFTDEEIQTGGLQIHTTIDKTAQDAAVATAKSMPEDADDAVEFSLVSIDPEDGGIVALYGGPDFIEHQFNNVTQGAAQPGSTFKPLTLIGALENGKQLTDRYPGYSPMQIIEPSADNPEGWNPGNFNNEQYGNIDLVEATAKSVNTVYGQLNVEIGPDKTVDVAHRLGIDSEIQAVASNVLGVNEVHPYELGTAYATIAAGGLHNDTHIVKNVTLANGDSKYDPPRTPERVVDPDVIGAATYAMTQVIEEPGGSGNPAQALDRPAAGKTGTANDNVAAWFAGFTPQLATVVGIWQPGEDGGNDTITPFGGYSEMTGGSWPVNAWTDYMTQALEGEPVEEFAEFEEPTPTYTPTEEPETEEPETEEPETEEPETVKVPGNLVGMSQANAVATLGALGLNAQVSEEYSDQPPGVVIRVSGAGNVPAGSTIGITVSKGPEPQAPDPDPEPTETEPAEPTEPPDPTEPTEPQPTETTPDPEGGGTGNNNGNGGGQ
ncbi:Membrane carboxypeptidase (penicillin-binding protein) [Paraoerskovia marina]|uniref:Membrane carboxypeptidase (Penicillin-binding protein) n=1 Tax=Paraoerskovia marina TaxID=545619 RepID=A0A1H1N361_9CELL|nr:transglycosylase domain-containing protein [Paraoerskovia marina]SDR93155.1 Membrane carboxypeptidase (penicillin-binding protein) [Paraoerskovia marina]